MTKATERPLRHLSIRTFRRLAQAHLQAERDVGKLLEQHGLSAAEFDLLAMVHAGEGVMQQDLAEHLVVSAPNITYHVRQLGKRGLLECRAEGRCKRLYLTPTGREAVEQALPEVIQFHDRQFAPLTAGETRLLGKLLQKLSRKE